jgi:TatD DNase family protein
MFDTHAHLDDEQLSAQRDDVIARAKAAGLAGIVAVGTTVQSSRNCAELAKTSNFVFASAGIHPNHAAEAQPGDWEEIVKLASEPHVVGIGETGLDRYWHDTPFELQQDYFDRHIRLSQQLDKAFIVHMRDCEADVLMMLRAARRRGPLRGVMHSFTGTAAGAAECLELGMYLSFAGMVTYKKSAELRAIAAQIPADRILIETDSPYLSPEPKRSHRPNEPALVVHTAQCLAEVRGAPLALFSALTTDNARRLFGV